MAGFRSKSSVFCCRLLLAALALCAVQAAASAEPTLEHQLAETGEIANFVPEKALKQLLRLEQAGRNASPEIKADYLTQMSLALRGTGQQIQAIALADETIALGKTKASPVALAKGLLAKGEILLIMNELEQSHRLIWESEKIAAATADVPLKIQTGIRSGQAYAEDGNFPAALVRLQAAVALARHHGNPVQMIRALNGLARLYRQLKDYDKSFDTLKEAMALATDINSPDEAHVADIFLVPLDDVAPRHTRRFYRNDGGELALRDNHAAGVLPQMARQVEHTNRKLKVLGDARMSEIESSHAELLLHRVGRALPLPRTDEPSKASQSVFIEAQRFANLAGC